MAPLGPIVAMPVLLGDHVLKHHIKKKPTCTTFSHGHDQLVGS